MLFFRDEIFRAFLIINGNDIIKIGGNLNDTIQVTAGTAVDK